MICMDKMIVTIVARVTKGNQPYNIEVNPDLIKETDSIMTFVYWLNTKNLTKLSWFKFKRL